MLRLGTAISAIALMSACNLSCGAALETKVATEANTETPQIALYQVTRDTLPKFKGWPRTGSKFNHDWLRHKHISSDTTIAINDLIDNVVWDSDGNSLLSGRDSRATQMKN